MAITTPRPDFRILPGVTKDNEFFWTAEADGRLRFQRCGACGYWIHPSGPICPSCHSKDVAPQAVAGEAVLHTYTVNRQAWLPGFEPPPYVVAIVELPEQEGLRLTTNLVNCASRTWRSACRCGWCSSSGTTSRCPSSSPHDGISQAQPDPDLTVPIAVIVVCAVIILVTLVRPGGSPPPEPLGGAGRAVLGRRSPAVGSGHAAPVLRRGRGVPASCRRWLDENPPPTEERARPAARAPTCRTGRGAGSARCSTSGWLVPGWPPELGGRNATPSSR